LSHEVQPQKTSGGVCLSLIVSRIVDVFHAVDIALHGELV
jgi:hypothetical protein